MSPVIRFVSTNWSDASLSWCSCWSILSVPFLAFNHQEAPMLQPELLSQDFELGFTYTRSTGPVVGRFLTELRDRVIVGIKGSDGKVYVPPMEYDPVTAEELSEFVEVGQSGEVVSWCWVKEPRDSHPSEVPFAWAMIRLDGADVPMVHVLRANAESEISTGMRVTARWADETRGFITDIDGFVAAGEES
jgi:uncharacterized OB-fold protein